MKHNRPRQRSPRHSTPSTICLPPPKALQPQFEPEVAARNGRVMRLSQRDEPLTKAAEPPQSRQMRRRAAREGAKQSRTKSPKPASTAKAGRQQTQARASAAVEQPMLAPLPRSMALALPRRGIAAWLSKIFASPRVKVAPSAREDIKQDSLAAQMEALRMELALAQKRLEGLIAAHRHLTTDQ